MASSEIKGFEELQRKLRDLPRLMGGHNAQTALMAGSFILVNGIKRRAPYLTGNLRRSYHAERGRASDTVAEVLVGTDVEYAPHQEFGTSKMSGTPHVRPAIDEERDQVLREVERIAETIIQRAAE